MKKCNRRRGRFCKGGNKSHFEHDCREHVTTEGREISGRERGDSWSGLGNKAQGEDETAKMEFRGEALEAPRLFMKLATWFLAAFS